MKKTISFWRVSERILSIVAFWISRISTDPTPKKKMPLPQRRHRRDVASTGVGGPKDGTSADVGTGNSVAIN